MLAENVRAGVCHQDFDFLCLELPLGPFKGPPKSPAAAHAAGDFGRPGPGGRGGRGPRLWSTPERNASELGLTAEAV